MELWTLLSKIECKRDNYEQACSVLRKAKNCNPETPELYLEEIKIESKPGRNHAKADAMMIEALKIFKNSGILWAEAISRGVPSERIKMSQEALKVCENDPHVVLAIAK